MRRGETGYQVQSQSHSRNGHALEFDVRWICSFYGKNVGTDCTTGKVMSFAA
jgi:hypothetical protein